MNNNFLSVPANAESSEYLDILNEIALDLHWSWSHASDEIWKKLDPVLWDLTHNPLVILRTVSPKRVEELLQEEATRSQIDEYVRHKKEVFLGPAWFQKAHPDANLNVVAYFSMEFMLSEALPIYSGGLGNVAGDHLKSASDLGVPVIGVGLLFQQGYSRQTISADGQQQDYFPYNDPGQLPISPLRTADGQWLRIEIRLPGYSLWLRTWKVQVGRVLLLLLDSNDSANFPAHRGITSELYGSGAELRLMQEMVLGLGGWRLLRSLGLKIDVCHLNEGHCAFAVLERAADFMEEHDHTFETALAVTRAGNLFTTHTALGAGFDCFSSQLMKKYLEWYAKDRLHITMEDLLTLGKVNPKDPSECFNMTHLAIRGSACVNAVSSLHAEVSKRLFSPLFPRWPVEEVPVSYVTNGVHAPSWDSPAADALWTKYCGKDRWLGTTESLESAILAIGDADIWNLHTANEEAFIAYIRKRYSRQLTIQGMPPEKVEAAKHIFNPHTLTIGFARRFVSYKRPNLLLHDPDRLCRLLTDPQKPVQLILAGKAHPQDRAAQQMIAEWFRFVQKYALENHVVFLSDYDMILTSFMVQGVDLWLNTPRRPFEACGTSGMKVLVNGGINLSALDGWWNEAWDPEVGWAFGANAVLQNDAACDAADANELYQILENEVVPEFYTRDAGGLPRQWIRRMRNSMAKLTPRFSANRSVREYTEKYYLAAADRYKHRALNGGEAGVRMVGWQHDLSRKWEHVRFGNLSVTSVEEGSLFSVEIYLRDIRPQEVTVELYADKKGAGEQGRHEMICKRNSQRSQGLYVYELCLATNRPVSDYTPRVLPRTDNILAPLECPLIRWQR